MGTVVEVGGVSRIEEDRLLVICKARAAIQLKDEPERTLLGYGPTTLQCFSLSAPLFFSSLFKESLLSWSASTTCVVAITTYCPRTCCTGIGVAKLSFAMLESAAGLKQQLLTAMRANLSSKSESF